MIDIRNMLARPQIVQRGDYPILEKQLARAQSQRPDSPMELVGGLAQVLAAKRDLRQAAAADKKKEQERNEKLAAILAGDGNLADRMIASGDPEMQKQALKFKLAEAGKAPAQPKAPFKMFDEEGRERYARWDPESDTGYSFVGGAKADDAGETTVVYAPDGTPIYAKGQGVSTSPDLTKATTTQVQKDVLNTQEGLARVKAIRKMYDPRFLTAKGRAGNVLRQAEAYLTGDIKYTGTPEEHAEFSAFHSETLNNINQYIKEISGAAVSAQEAERLKGALPHPDLDPATFKARLDRVADQMEDKIQRLNAVLGRYQPGTEAEFATALRGLGFSDAEIQQKLAALQKSPSVGSTMSTSSPAVNFQGEQYNLDPM